MTLPAQLKHEQITAVVDTREQTPLDLDDIPGCRHSIANRPPSPIKPDCDVSRAPERADCSA